VGPEDWSLHWKPKNAEDAVGAPVTVEILLCDWLESMPSLARDEQAARLDTNLDFFRAEAGDLRAYNQHSISFRNVNVGGMKQFGFGAAPIFHSVALGPPSILKKLKGPAGNRLVKQLRTLRNPVHVDKAGSRYRCKTRFCCHL
jgi:hypothetical protein